MSQALLTAGPREAILEKRQLICTSIESSQLLGLLHSQKAIWRLIWRSIRITIWQGFFRKVPVLRKGSDHCEHALTLLSTNISTLIGLCLPGNSTIEITQLQNRSLDVFNNDIVMEATQYDVYCWAEDDAINGVGFPKHNFMTQDGAQLERARIFWLQFCMAWQG